MVCVRVNGLKKFDDRDYLHMPIYVCIFQNPSQEYLKREREREKKREKERERVRQREREWERVGENNKEMHIGQLKYYTYMDGIEKLLFIRSCEIFFCVLFTLSK